MKSKTCVSIISKEADIALQNMKAVCSRFNIKTEIGIAGNELLIEVPDNGDLGFSLNELRFIVNGRVDMFELSIDQHGNQSRWWYCLT